MREAQVPCNMNLENTNVNAYWIIIMWDSRMLYTDIQNTTVGINLCLRYKYYHVCQSMQTIISNMWPGKATCGSASSNLWSPKATIKEKKGLWIEMCPWIMACEFNVKSYFFAEVGSLLPQEQIFSFCCYLAALLWVVRFITVVGGKLVITLL